MANEIFMPPDDTYVVQHKSGELPTVTVADDGKVLKVIDGSWGAGEASGASGLVVHVTNVVGYTALDKSYNELKSAYDNGIKPVFTMHTEQAGGTYDMYNFALLGIASAENEGQTVYEAILRIDPTSAGDSAYIELGATDPDDPLTYGENPT